MGTIDGDQVLIIIMHMIISLYTVVDSSRRIQAKVICMHYKYTLTLIQSIFLYNSIEFKIYVMGFFTKAIIIYLLAMNYS